MVKEKKRPDIRQIYFLIENVWIKKIEKPKNFKIHTETFFVFPYWRKFFVILHIAEFKYMYFFCK